VNTNKSTKISIVLWPDTPHAAWTWLQQIQKEIWDGAYLQMDASSTIFQFKPPKPNRRMRTTATTTNDADNADNAGDGGDDSYLEFIEQHPMIHDNEEYVKNHDLDVNHGAWTVGLRETSMTTSSKRRKREGKQHSNDNDNDIDNNNNLEMFINLSDNQHLYQHEATCVGKIIDGFDTLQRLLETTITTRKRRTTRDYYDSKKTLFFS